MSKSSADSRVGRYRESDLPEKRSLVMSIRLGVCLLAAILCGTALSAGTKDTSNVDIPTT